MHQDKCLSEFAAHAPKKNINKEKEEARIKSQTFKVVQQDFLNPQAATTSFFFTSIKIQ